MASNHTPNFNLSQWEKTDKVQMEDFNADNAKIDAALACHPSGELIASVTVEEELARLELDLTQVDWSRYMALALISDTKEYNGFSVTMGNGNRGTYITSQVQNTYFHDALVDVGYAAHVTVLIPVFYDGRHSVSALSLTFGWSGSSNVTCLGGGGGASQLNECSYIAINRNSGRFLSGDRVVLWGVK